MSTESQQQPAGVNEAQCQAGLPASGGSARPFEQQTPLERVLRAHLWQPMDLLKRCEERLPKLVRNKEYKEAGECQTWISQAKRDIKDWEYILSLYEAERQAPNAALCDPAYVDAGKPETL